MSTNENFHLDAILELEAQGKFELVRELAARALLQDEIQRIRSMKGVLGNKLAAEERHRRLLAKARELVERRKYSTDTPFESYTHLATAVVGRGGFDMSVDTVRKILSKAMILD